MCERLYTRARDRDKLRAISKLLHTVDLHMEMVTKMISEEEDSRVVTTYNIGNHFRGYHGKMSSR